VKVVLSLAIGTCLFLITHSGTAQSSISKPPEKLTFNIRALPFQEAIRHLEKITGLHFIYSSNKIQSSQKITLNITDKSLDEVLTLLGNKTNLLFKKNDKYIVIKAGKERNVAPNIQRGRKSPESKMFNYTLTVADSMVLRASISKYERPEPAQVSELSFSKPYFKNHFQELAVYFDTVRLKQLSVKEVRQINIKNRHQGWFFSGGIRLSQYSGGAEFQAGIRSLYVVFSPGVIKGGRYHGAYGLGTSLLLKNNLSFNPMYTYFAFQQKANYAKTMSTETVSTELLLAPYDLAFTAKHHQVKLLFRYAFNENLNIHFGPVFNTLQTTYHMPQIIMIGQVAAPSGAANDARFGSSVSSETRIVKRFIQYPPQTQRSWLNWEASFSYRLNFFKRP
jgi:hypothetical protein